MSAEIRGMDGNTDDEMGGNVFDLYPETMFTESSRVNAGNGIDDSIPARNRTKHRHHGADAFPPAEATPSASARLVPPFYRTFKYL